MTLVTVIGLDGQPALVESNEEIYIHAVDAGGYYVGLVAPAEGLTAAASAPPQGDRRVRWDGQQWVADPTLAEAKRARRNYVNDKRDQAEFGTFTWDGSVFDCDKESRNKLMGAVVMATLASISQSPFEEVWTLADDTSRTLSAEDLISVGMVLGSHVSTVHATSRALKDAIEVATTIEEVNAINWP